MRGGVRSERWRDSGRREAWRYIGAGKGNKVNGFRGVREALRAKKKMKVSCRVDG